MLILTIRTDKPEAEIGLFEDHEKATYLNWPAHRQLAESIHQKIEDILTQQNMTWKDIGGIICFRGPGSFTGLRIGLTVANALAYSLAIPIVSETGQDWLDQGVTRLMSGDNEISAMPMYGQPVHITKPRK